MPETTGRPHSRLDPAPAWTVLTDSPLKGLALAREAALVFAWDEGDQLYLLDSRGQHRSVARAPGRIQAASISDTGTLVALLLAGSRVLLLSADFEPIADRSAPSEPTALAVDAHGRYVAAATRTGGIHFYTRHGRLAGTCETRLALAHLAFVPAQPFLVGAAAFGGLVGIDLHGGHGSGKLSAAVAWEESLLSNVGRLTTSGDGGMVLVSCFTHGVQRYDLRGHNDGAYHLGGTAARATTDFAGRLIAVATLEGELVILSPGGHVRWRKGLPRPAIALEADPLGRFLIHGHETGEIVRLDLESSSSSASASERPAGDGGATTGAGAGAGATSGAPRSLRKPDWSVPAVATDEQAETAVVAVLDDPPRIGLFSSSNRNRLQVFTTEGRNLGFAPETLGIGRILRTSPGWIASATDRQVALYDARRNLATKLDASLVEVTHLVIRPDTFGLAIVQERDRVGRVALSGRWIWKSELRSPVEDIAIGPGDHAALTREDGRLEVYDPAGTLIGQYTSEPSEPLCLIEAPRSAPAPVAWVTLARRAQILRGHDVAGGVLWETAIAWEGWLLQGVGPLALISAPDGRAIACDGSGTVVAESRPSGGGVEVFGASTQGVPWRVARQGVHLICSEFSGRVRWRSVADQPLGPLACGTAGVAVLIGRDLAWFPAEVPDSV
jgi:hypothetical protein